MILIKIAPQKEATIPQLNPGVSKDASQNINAFIASVKKPSERILIDKVTAIRNGRTFVFTRVNTIDAPGATHRLSKFIPLNSNEVI